MNRKRLLLLAVAGVLFLLIWTGGFLIPASLFTYHKPIPPWSVPLVPILGPNQTGFLRFSVPLVLLWAVYFCAVGVTYGLTSRSALAITATISILSTGVGALVYPGGSADIWRYIADGRLLWVYSENPLVTVPYFYRFDPLIERVPDWIFTPSPYGPLWHMLTVFPTIVAGDGPLANLLAFKLLMVTFFLLGLPLVYWTAERIRAGSGVTAALIYGWNPLLIWSSAVDGHNDIVMAFFMLLSLYEMGSRRWGTAIPLLFLAALIKYTALLLLPVAVALAWKQKRRAALLRLGLGLITGLGIAVVAWLPFWRGPETLHTLRLASDRALNSLLATAMFLSEPDRTSWVGIPPLLRLTFTAAFLGCTAVVLVRFFRRSQGDFREGVQAGLALIFAYLVLQSWWFFPWYLCWLLPLGAVLARRRAAILTMIYTASAMTIFVTLGWWAFLTPTWTRSLLSYHLAVTTLTLGPPLLYVSLLLLRVRRHGLSPLVPGLRSRA